MVLFESCLSADFLLGLEDDEAPGKPVAAEAGEVVSRAFPGLDRFSFFKDDFRGPPVCIASVEKE